ncbi:MAG: thioredoxin domain-containing protein [Pontixanthobacter sp.]
MNIKQLLRAAALTAVAAMTIGASGNWNAAVVKFDRGYQIGNPDAKVKLTEFVSYTCPHCKSFTDEGEPALQIAYISSGKLLFEIRPYIRNDIDLTATMLVQCGGTEKFHRNHTMFMINQRTWLDTAGYATKAQQQRWSAPEGAAARRAIASDLGFYGMMESRGYNRPEIDNCLNDDAEAQRLEANTIADAAEFQVTGTPTFAINGQKLEKVWDWRTLEPVLNGNF